MNNNPAAVKVTQADKRAADEILRCLDATVNDHSYDELLLILAEHRIAAEKRRQDVTALYAYEAGFEGAESILREQVERLARAIEDTLNNPDCITTCDLDEALADYRKDNPV